MKKAINAIAPLALLLIFLVLILTVFRASIFEDIEPEKHIYFEIIFLLLLAVVGELAVVYLKLPSVIVLLILGILISPSFLSMSFDFFKSLNLPFTIPKTAPILFKSEDVIQIFAQLGAIVLLFKVGLHNKMEGIFAFDNILVAACGVILPFLAGYLYATGTGGDFSYSMFLGAALTATSVGVTVALLKEFNLLGQRFAQIIIGAAVIDDILGLLVLSFVINATSGNGSFVPIIYTGVTAAIFLFGSVVAGNYFIKYLDRKDMSPRRFLLVFALMLSYAYIAEYIKLSAIVGAFMAGVIINQSRHIQEIEEKTYGLELLFMPIFFITLGMLVDVNALVQFTIPIIIITIIAVFSKLIACSGAAYYARLGVNESLAVGIGMAPRGEVALIVASIGLTTGILNSGQYSIITAMALLTTLIAPPLLAWTLNKRKI